MRDAKDDLFKLVKSIGSKKNMRIVGREMIKLIVKRTRMGKDIDGQKFPALAESTIKLRKRYKLHSSTSPGKANNTMTGQLLKSLGVVKADKGEIWIGVIKSDRKHPTLKKRTKKKSTKAPATNDEVMEYLEEQGRNFNGLTKANWKSLLRTVRILLKDDIRRSKFKP